jgi:hypothetical protein
MWIQFFRPKAKATGRIEFFARLLLNSSCGYSKKRVGLPQRLSVYLQGLASALAVKPGNAASTRR